MTIWENTIGKSFSWIPNLLIVLSYFNLTINLYGEISSLLQDIFEYFNFKYNNPIPLILVDSFFVIYIFLAIPSILISFAKEIHNFVIISWIKFLCFIVFALHIYKFIIDLLEPTFSVSTNIQISINGSFNRLCSNFVYAISISCWQPIIEHIVQVMAKPTLGRTTNIYFISTLSGLIITLMFTILTTLLIDQNSFRMPFYVYYEYSNKIFAFIFLLMTIYFMQWMEARHFSQVFSGSWKLSKWMDIFWIPNTLSCFIAIIVNASGNYFPYLGFVIADILGKIGAIIICMILAPVYYLRMFFSDKSRKVWIILSILLIIIELFFIAFTCYIDAIEIVSFYASS